jgi:hypothetical protein
MIDLYNDTTGELIGQLTEADLQVLVDALEEESTQDRDYSLTRPPLRSLPTGEPQSILSHSCEKLLGRRTEWTFGGNVAATIPRKLAERKSTAPPVPAPTSGRFARVSALGFGAQRASRFTGQ